MMSAEQVIETLAALTQIGISAWVDGGWGVDALIGEQTRDHGDLDLVIPIDSLPTCRRLLTDEGFRVERDWLPTALAMRHSDGRGIDLHPVVPADDGGGDQIQLDGVRRWHYGPPVTGTIAGEPVWCCSPECKSQPIWVTNRAPRIVPTWACWHGASGSTSHAVRDMKASTGRPCERIRQQPAGRSRTRAAAPARRPSGHARG